MFALLFVQTISAPQEGFMLAGYEFVLRCNIIEIVLTLRGLHIAFSN